MRSPSSQQGRNIILTLASLVLCGAAAQALPSSTRAERDCLAASVRWSRFACAVSDLDGDHKADYAIVESSSGVVGRAGVLSIRLSSTTDVREVPLPEGRPALAFALRDMNGDGHVDIALIGGLNQTIGVLLNDGSGKFEFDFLDRYLTAPDPDNSGLTSPLRSPEWPCTASNDGSQDAALRSERWVPSVDGGTSELPDSGLPAPFHFSDPPRSRAP